jgi:hypothetical protein
MYGIRGRMEGELGPVNELVESTHLVQLRFGGLVITSDLDWRLPWVI